MLRADSIESNGSGVGTLVEGGLDNQDNLIDSLY